MKHVLIKRQQTISCYYCHTSVDKMNFMSELVTRVMIHFRRKVRKFERKILRNVLATM